MDINIKKRCIMIFPQFKNINVIDEIREKYDPLAKHVRPHITFVFPFDSSISTIELMEHMINALSSIKPFEITLKGITGVNSFGNYLFLNIENGKNEIIEIHKKLYEGILEEFLPEWLTGGGYYPHMTIGKIDNEEGFQIAINETKNITEVFEAIVNVISVEIIDENEDSLIEIEVNLN
jgi:2'-5' RNA ligase